MKVAVLSDIHANQYAFRAVVAHAKKLGIETFWFLGDLFGYGPHAMAVCDLAGEIFSPDCWCIGNHDATFAGLLYSKLSREDAIDVIATHIAEMKTDPEKDEWIRDLFTGFHKQQTISVKTDNKTLSVMLTHGCLKDAYMLYVYPWTTNEDLMDYMVNPGMKTCEGMAFPRVIFFGHSHIPALLYFQEDKAVDIPIEQYGVPYAISPEWSFINPGSVGQPRDMDARAAYAVFDTLALNITFYRVEYDLFSTVVDLQKNHYPDNLRKQLMNANGPRPPDEYRQLLLERKEKNGG